MSYILDALKKSEEERRQVSSPPSIFSPKPEPPAQHSVRFGFVLWGGLIITLVILLAAGYYTIGKKVISINITLPQQAESTSPQPLPQNMKEDEPAPEEQAPAEKNSPPEQPKDATPKVAAAEVVAPEVTATKVVAEEAVAEEPPEKPKTVNESEATHSAEVVAEPAPLPESQIQEKIQVPPPPPKAPHLSELDPAFRRTIPDFKLAGHVYSDDASLRMVMINNQIARENDVVEESFILEEIVPEGIILRSGATRFLLDSK